MDDRSSGVASGATPVFLQLNSISGENLFFRTLETPGTEGPGGSFSLPSLKIEIWCHVKKTTCVLEHELTVSPINGCFSASC